MIISRKYEWLGALYQNDASSKAAIDRAFNAVDIPAKQKEYLLEYNRFNIPAFLNLGCGIPGRCYALFMEKFEELDKTNPYENGLSFNDVSDIEFEKGAEGAAIQMRFVSKTNDGIYRIVGFAALTNKNGKMAMSKGWQMIAPFMIG